VETLEDRTLLSISFSGPGNSGVATVTGTPGADQFIIRLNPSDATMIEFSDDGGSTFTDAVLSGITAVNVNGLQGNDTLTIDESNGLVAQATPLPISFDGGTGRNMLVVEGTTTGTVTETFTLGTSRGSGMLTTTDGTVSSTVTLTSVRSIQDTLTADTLTITGNDNGNFIHVHNGPVVNGFKTDTVKIRDVNAVNDNLDDGGDEHGNGQGDNSQGDNGQGNGDNGNGQGDNGGDQGDVRRRDDQGNNDQGDDQGEGDDNGGTLMSFSFANKTNVMVTGGAGNDFFLVTIGTAADGLQTLTLDGGGGMNVGAIRQLPQSVTLTLKNIQVQQSDADAAFIESMFEERLDRPAAASEVAIWMNVLSQGGLAAVATGIENSPEARTMLVKNLYQQYLGRNAVGGEEQGWVQLMLRGEGQEQILAGILSSAEFYQRAQTLITSGTPDERYIQALYSAVLGRTASAAEVSNWLQLLPTVGRFGVALGFVESTEFRTNMVTAFYSNFLQRAPDAAGLAAWVRSGQDLNHIRQGFEMSNEFFADN
jgi:hypothetical protein